MKKQIILNALVVIFFVLLSGSSLFFENVFNESTNELIFIILLLVFLLTLVLINRKTFAKVQNKGLKIAYRLLLIFVVFVIGFGLSYLVNWFFLIPLIF